MTGTLFSMQLQQQLRKAQAEAEEEGMKLDAHQLAKKLDLPGYTFKVRTALGGGWSGDCLRQLRHFFLTCVAPGEYSKFILRKGKSWWRGKPISWSMFQLIVSLSRMEGFCPCL